MGGSSIRERSRSVTRAAAALSAALFAGAACGCVDDPLPGPTRLSLLAVGDTGAPPDKADRYRNQLAVAAALEADARDRPVQGLLLLGDQFYDSGLEPDDLVARIRANIVRPYCRFLALAGPRSSEVANACAVPPGERQPVPLYVTLGNHDTAGPHGAALQREAVPRFVSNWILGPGPVAIHRLGTGTSLVIFDSIAAFAGGDVTPLRDALSRTPGPWRIVAAHHPMAVVGTSEEALYRSYRRRLAAAIAESGVPVHLFLAGHEHNLQILSMAPPAPALHVVAGGGSSARSIHDANPRRRAGFESLGYARIDLVGEGADTRLVASLYRVPPRPLRWAAPRKLATRWSVDLHGRVREE